MGGEGTGIGDVQYIGGIKLSNVNGGHFFLGCQGPKRGGQK